MGNQITFSPHLIHDSHYRSDWILEFMCFSMLVPKGPQHVMQFHDGSFQIVNIEIKTTRLNAQISQLVMSR